MRNFAIVLNRSWKAIVGVVLAIVLGTGLVACGSSGSDTTVAVDNGGGSAGFLTPQASLAAPLAGAQITPILTVGDFPLSPDNPSGSELETFAPTPDGIGAFVGGDGQVVVFVNHEINAVGQGFGSPGVDTEVEGVSAFIASRVSRLELDRSTLGVTDLSYPVDGSENYARLCSGAYAGAAEGLPSGFWLAGEEAVPSALGDISIAVSRDGSTTFELPCLGRFSHENEIAVPHPSGQVVVIGTDDAFPPGEDSFSEMYMFVADSEGDLLSCNGELYVLSADGVAVSGNLTQGQPVTTRWVQVPDPFISADGLQDFADANGALSFVRLEDADYDRRSGFGPSIFFVDTADPDVTGNSRIGATCNGICDENGSLYRLDFDPSDPTGPGVLTLEVRSAGPSGFWASPDNIGTSQNGIMINEDPNFDFGRNGGIWYCPFAGTGISGCSEVAELLDEGGETSGILSTADIFGPGTWLFAVQAHDVPQPLLGLAEENGQLSLLTVSGS